MSTVEYIKDGDVPVFRVTFKSADHVWAAGEVESINAWNDTETWEPCEDGTEGYLEFCIKWDGCSHLTFGTAEDNGNGDFIRDGQLHMCGADDYRRHLLLIQELYAMAFRHMGREPEESLVFPAGNVTPPL